MADRSWVVGDPTTGLSIGATMQLMSMGVVAVGGSSMPDYPIAAIIADNELQ